MAAAAASLWLAAILAAQDSAMSGTDEQIFVFCLLFIGGWCDYSVEVHYYRTSLLFSSKGALIRTQRNGLTSVPTELVQHFR
jgi:hypothetical protein